MHIPVLGSNARSKEPVMLGFTIRCIPVLVLTAMWLAPATALAQSPIQVSRLNGQLASVVPGGPAAFVLEGEGTRLGRFTAAGEVTFTAGTTPHTLQGQGVVVFRAANEDRLVGTVTWLVGAPGPQGRGSSVSFRWQSAVTFSDGTVVTTSGGFVENQPMNLVLNLTIFARLAEEVVAYIISLGPL
jgi:hypothetical protein